MSTSTQPYEFARQREEEEKFNLDLIFPVNVARPSQIFFFEVHKDVTYFLKVQSFLNIYVKKLSSNSK